MAVFASRQIVMPVLSVTVTITGTGSSNSCYATINGTKQYEAGTYEVDAGDTITFGVIGASSSSTYNGLIIIDGTEVLRVTSANTETYDWIVPDGISTIEISMETKGITSSIVIASTITVTTA